ncbi:Hypothetical_protein [Hexamita inflata]|uniref:Hypothetical_protein n=1 Tax=Hexamita inflata TaxID=28002 RepID=A0AA86TVF2_9EUKA|nr:Hypothetical protein HINF_LOCUS10758 [Hexamita inflata]
MQLGFVSHFKLIWSFNLHLMSRWRFRYKRVLDVLCLQKQFLLQSIWKQLHGLSNGFDCCEQHLLLQFHVVHGQRYWKRDDLLCMSNWINSKQHNKKLRLQHKLIVLLVRKQHVHKLPREFGCDKQYMYLQCYQVLIHEQQRLCLL